LQAPVENTRRLKRQSPESGRNLQLQCRPRLGTKGLLRVVETACIKGQSDKEIEAAQAISEHALSVNGQSAKGGRHRKPEVQNTRSV
jgi:hypothetical protein